jgi:plasmid stabilization system protein ParE
MPALKWAPPALKDIERPHSFLKSRNPDAAKRVVRAIRQGVGLLEQQPEAGRPFDDLPLEFREWPIAFGTAKYIVLYRFDGKEVILLAVRHEREIGY